MLPKALWDPGISKLPPICALDCLLASLCPLRQSQEKAPLASGGPLPELLSPPRCRLTLSLATLAALSLQGHTKPQAACHPSSSGPYITGLSDSGDFRSQQDHRQADSGFWAELAGSGPGLGPAGKVPPVPWAGVILAARSPFHLPSQPGLLI